MWAVVVGFPGGRRDHCSFDVESGLDDAVAVAVAFVVDNVAAALVKVGSEKALQAVPVSRC